MSHETSMHDSNQSIRFERTYDGPIDDLWELWTTKDGFEAWWGPEGFRVEVSNIEARIDGELRYDMIADRAEEIAYMKQQGWGVRHGVRGVFIELDPKRRLAIRQRIDFIPGVKAYDNDMHIELVPEGSQVRMIIEVQAHPDAQWTRNAAHGFESQLTKIPAALAGRRAS